MVRNNQTQYILKLELAGFNDSLDMMCERNRRVKMTPTFWGDDVLKEFDHGEDMRVGSITRQAQEVKSNC